MEGLSTVTIDGEVYEMWDSTKLKSYSCEMRGKLEHEEHLTLLQPSEAIAFGQMMHKAAEVWTFQAGICGMNEAEAVEAGELAGIKEWEALLPLETREMLEFSGDRRSVANFTRLFAGFRKKFPLAMYDRIVEVEKPFALPLGKTAGGVKVAWCGKRDRVLGWQGGVYYVDIKTSTYALDESFFNKWKLSGQMIGYAWAGQQELGMEFSGILVQGIQVQAPLKTKQRVAEELCQAEVIPITTDTMERWRENTLRKIHRIHQARDEQSYIMDYGDQCNNFRGCAMARLCAAPQELQPLLKQQHYKVRVWNPMEAEGGVE